MNGKHHFRTKSVASVFVFLWLGCVSAFAQRANEPVREWTDMTGKYTVQARLERIDVDQVVLRKTDGTVARVPINRLSQADREYVESRTNRPPENKKENAVTEGLEISATISRKEPFDIIIFSDIEQQNPIFVTLTIKGQSVVDAAKYGKFKFDSISDDQGNSLKLLVPLKGKFNEELDSNMADVNHFFLEKPDTLKLHLVVSNPAADANSIKIDGSFYLDIVPSITIKDVLKNLNQPLKAPGLDKIGQFVASYPERGESDVEGSLAIDFTGDRKKIDTVELLDGSGIQISTGGMGTGNRSKARIIRWAGEKLPEDTQLRVVLAGDSKESRFPITLKNVVIDPNKQKPKTGTENNGSNSGSANRGQNRMEQGQQGQGQGEREQRGQGQNGQGQSGRGQNSNAAHGKPAPVNIAVAFFQACRQGNLDIVKKHLQSYPSLNHRKDPRWKETAFSKACWNGRLEVIKYLLEQGADINARAGDLVTPLHQAARQGQLETVKFLLNNGADKTLKDNKGQTASDMAKTAGHTEVVRTITDHSGR